MTPAHTTDPHPASASQHLFLAAQAFGPAGHAGHAGGHAGVQMQSHKKGLGSSQPQEPLQDSSVVSLRQDEEAKGTEAEGSPALVDGGDQAKGLEAMVRCSWGEREGSAAKVHSHQDTESSGLDIDAFLPPSLSPRQARSTALITTPPDTPQKSQKAVSGFCNGYHAVLPAWNLRLTEMLPHLCRPAAVCACVRVCVCARVPQPSLYRDIAPWGLIPS